jgi:hypothetical protein
LQHPTWHFAAFIKKCNKRGKYCNLERLIVSLFFHKEKDTTVWTDFVKKWQKMLDGPGGILKNILFGS